MTTEADDLFGQEQKGPAPRHEPAAGVWGVAFPIAYALLSTQCIYGFWIGIAVGQFVATVLLYLRMRWVLRNPEYVYRLRDEDVT